MLNEEKKERERERRERGRGLLRESEKTNGRERRERNGVEYPTNSSDPDCPRDSMDLASRSSWKYFAIRSEPEVICISSGKNCAIHKNSIDDASPSSSSSHPPSRPTYHADDLSFAIVHVAGSIIRRRADLAWLRSNWIRPNRFEPRYGRLFTDRGKILSALSAPLYRCNSFKPVSQREICTTRDTCSSRNAGPIIFFRCRSIRSSHGSESDRHRRWSETE